MLLLCLAVAGPYRQSRSLILVRLTHPQLGYYSPERARYEKHRDALPDDGTEEEQRRVTAIVYTSSAWEPSHGGQLRMWRPKPQARTGLA